MAVEQEMSPIDKFIRGLISEEEYLALISGEETLAHLRGLGPVTTAR